MIFQIKNYTYYLIDGKSKFEARVRERLTGDNQKQSDSHRLVVVEKSFKKDGRTGNGAGRRRGTACREILRLREHRRGGLCGGLRRPRGVEGGGGSSRSQRQETPV